MSKKVFTTTVTDSEDPITIDSNVTVDQSNSVVANQSERNRNNMSYLNIFCVCAILLMVLVFVVSFDYASAVKQGEGAKDQEERQLAIGGPKQTQQCRDYSDCGYWQTLLDDENTTDAEAKTLTNQYILCTYMRKKHNCD
jgi:hypothetical protein